MMAIAVWVSHHFLTLRQFKLKYGKGRQFTILLDSAVGILVAYCLWQAPIDEWAWTALRFMIRILESTIDWLSKYPAGLKLNDQVNQTLSQFFSYHIFLWETFVSVVWSNYGVAAFLSSGLFGISTILATLIDVMNLLTIHILCFHIYASRQHFFVHSVAQNLPLLDGRKIQASVQTLVKLITMVDERHGLLYSEDRVSNYGGVVDAQSNCSDAKVNPVTLSWHNISVTTKKNNRLLLNDVNGVCEAGQLMALMGASGAGKTTLLNTLLARNLSGLMVSGDVLVNGHSMGEKVTHVSGYAQQEDLFMSTLTVSEHLMIQAKLRIAGRVSVEERAERVNFVMQQLGLIKCRNTRIGISGVKKGISGGESKRVTFAAELLTNPPILFCDEPTTGLDSFMAESVIAVLKDLANSGKTIICTIHQPSSQLYNMFDRVLYLAAGRVAFLGRPEDAVALMETCGYTCPHNFNPADSIIETLAVTAVNKEECLKRVNAICDSFAASEGGKAVMNQLDSCKRARGNSPQLRSVAPLADQFVALLHRAVIDNWRNPSLARAKVIQKVLMGLFVGFLYLNTNSDSQSGVYNLNGALFYLVAELTYSTLFGILTFMPGDYPILVREYHDGLYSVSSYYASRALSYAPLFTLDGFLMIGISYWLVGFASSSFLQVFIMFLTALLIEQSASAFGVMLSTVSPSYAIAVSIAGPILTLLSLTGGLYANVGELPSYISWIQYLSWFRYGFEGFVINQWTNVTTGFTNETAFHRSNEILGTYSFNRNNLSFDLSMMALSIVSFYLIGYCGLYLRVKLSR